MRFDVDLREQAGFLVRTAKRALRARDEDGSALVETAVVIPLLLLMLTVAASYSWSIYSLQQLGNAVTAAVEALGSESRSVSNPCTVVVTEVTGALPLWNAANLTYTVTFSNTAGDVTPSKAYSWTGSTAPSACSAEGVKGSTPQVVDAPVSVTVQYTISGMQILNMLPGSHVNPLTNLSSSESAMAF